MSHHLCASDQFEQFIIDGANKSAAELTNKNRQQVSERFIVPAEMNDLVSQFQRIEQQLRAKAR